MANEEISNDKALQLIKDVIYKETSKGVNDSEIVIDIKKLQESAKKYHEQYIPLASYIEQYNKIKKIQKKTRQKKFTFNVLKKDPSENSNAFEVETLQELTLDAFGEKIKIKKEEFQETALKFQDDYNAFLGRKIILTYVDQKTGQIYFAKEGKESEMWNKKSKEMSFSTLISKIKSPDLSYTFDTLENEIKKDTQKRENLQKVHKRHNEIIGAYTSAISKRFDKPWMYYHNYQNTDIKEQNKRHYLYVGNKGIFSEAYVGDIFDIEEGEVGKKQFDKKTDGINWGLESAIYHLIKQHAVNVDSVWGGYQGDISTKDNSIGLAVKSGKATLGGWKYFDDIAQYLMTVDTNFSPKDLEAFIGKNTIYSAGQQLLNVSQEVLRESFKKIENKINNETIILDKIDFEKNL